MHEKIRNEDDAKVEFDKRVRETKQQAMEDNKKKALASGNLLTQTLNEDGQLVSVKDLNTTEQRLGSSSLSDIRRELFEGDNIVTAQNTDHGLSRVSALRAPSTM